MRAFSSLSLAPKLRQTAPLVDNFTSPVCHLSRKIINPAERMEIAQFGTTDFSDLHRFEGGVCATAPIEQANRKRPGIDATAGTSTQVTFLAPPSICAICGFPSPSVVSPLAREPSALPFGPNNWGRAALLRQRRSLRREK
jgi:hypothetical protein